MKEKIDKPVFHTVGAAADSLGRECYVVGGYVRDLMLGRESKDIDFVTVGSGIEVARAVSRQLRGHLAVYKNFGTAQVKRRPRAGIRRSQKGVVQSRQPQAYCGGRHS